MMMLEVVMVEVVMVEVVMVEVVMVEVVMVEVVMVEVVMVEVVMVEVVMVEVVHHPVESRKSVSLEIALDTSPLIASSAHCWSRLMDYIHTGVSIYLL